MQQTETAEIMCQEYKDKNDRGEGEDKQGFLKMKI